MCNRKPLIPNMILDETWFSDPVTGEELKLWYMLSKTLAEEAVWKFAKENGLEDTQNRLSSWQGNNFLE
uniref:Uncharacterized protein n=1 Tax=Fagus sylvatica TaxID=28930 RepID=A0A2N9EVR4_FAGSY